MPMPDQDRSATIGILCAIGAATAFSFNDMAVKLLSGGYPLHQIVFFRALVALTITIAIIMPLDGGLVNVWTKRPWAHVLRGLFVVVANTTFFTGIAVLPLADATAVFFVAPLIITGLSVLILREWVGPRRWMAVIAGLVGVLIVVRPGAATFSPMVFLPILAALAYASVQIMTRSMGLTEKASTLAMYIHLTFLIVSACAGLVIGDGRFAGQENDALEFLLRPWIWPHTSDAVFMIVLGCSNATAGYLISLAYRNTNAGVIAPFEYVALVWAVAWGIMVFAEWPDASTWLGIVLIIAAGVYTAVREGAIGRRPSAKRVGGRR